MFIDGKQFEVKPPAAATGPGGGAGRFGGRGASGGAPPSNAVSAAGVWTISVNSPQGAITVTLNLRQEGNVVTGDATSPFGTAQVTEGQVTGNELRFGYTVTIQGQQVPVSARGVIEGNSIRGTMSVTGQDVEFTGTRAPQR